MIIPSIFPSLLPCLLAYQHITYNGHNRPVEYWDLENMLWTTVSTVSYRRLMWKQKERGVASRKRGKISLNILSVFSSIPWFLVSYNFNKAEKKSKTKTKQKTKSDPHGDFSTELQRQQKPWPRSRAQPPGSWVLFPLVSSWVCNIEQRSVWCFSLYKLSSVKRCWRYHSQSIGLKGHQQLELAIV